MRLLEVLDIFFKHKKIMAKMFITTVAGVTAVSMYQKPVYQARATLLVQPEKELTSRPGQRTVTVAPRPGEYLNTEIEILTCDEVAEKVLKILQVDKVFPGLKEIRTPTNVLTPMAQAVGTFEKRLKVLPVKDSNVLSITFEHPDPEIAAKAVNHLVDAYVEKHVSIHDRPQALFVGDQLAALRARLAESEKNLTQYQHLKSAFALAQQRSLLLKQRSDLDSAYRLSQGEITELSRKAASLRGRIRTLAAGETKYSRSRLDEAVATAKSTLLQQQLKEQELLRKYSASNELVAEAQRQIALTNEFLKKEEESISGKTRTGNVVYQELEMEMLRTEAALASQAGRADTLKSQLLSVTRQIAELDATESDLERLKREQAMDDVTFRRYADRYEEARLEDDMNRRKFSNIKIIEAAVPPGSPSKPNLALNLFAGFVYGIAAALGWAYLLEDLEGTYSDPERVQKDLRLPVLVTVTCDGKKPPQCCL
jgi:uncharacterized protein involved in exopolysaccharide biosynthesis